MNFFLGYLSDLLIFRSILNQTYYTYFGKYKTFDNLLLTVCMIFSWVEKYVVDKNGGGKSYRAVALYNKRDLFTSFC